MRRAAVLGRDVDRMGFEEVGFGEGKAFRVMLDTYAGAAGAAEERLEELLTKQGMYLLAKACKFTTC